MQLGQHPVQFPATGLVQAFVGVLEQQLGGAVGDQLEEAEFPSLTGT